MPGTAEPPFTVTSDYAVKLRRPTPSGGPLRVRARVVESSHDRAVVEATMEADGLERASCRGTFVAVKPGHPAYARWQGTDSGFGTRDSGFGTKG